MQFAVFLHHCVRGEVGSFLEMLSLMVLVVSRSIGNPEL
jgi:hypothetical protein